MHQVQLEDPNVNRDVDPKNTERGENGIKNGFTELKYNHI